ncbi:cysteine desulfurase family protein [Bacteroidota bacterium]
MNVYLDNAATTKPDPEVVEAMLPYISDHFGNPSSTHSYGREVKSAIEESRKSIAELLEANPSEIYFTSGGTEADNIALCGMVDSYRIKTIISTKIEHHAVTHSLDHLQKTRGTQIFFLDLDSTGQYEGDQLESILKDNKSTLVSLMHGNNEIGNLVSIKRIGELCREYNAYFQSDTVQTMGKYKICLHRLDIHSISGSAHKFHGPKGIGLLYLNKELKIGPYFHGGGQEREMRPGTENVAGIVGLAKALETANEDLETKQEYISALKDRLINRLKEQIPGVTFNGLSGDLNKSLFNIINMRLPGHHKSDMLLFQLDLKGISASGGSACGSGALVGSHVLNAIQPDDEGTSIRFSLSKFNTPEEVDYAANTLADMIVK